MPDIQFAASDVKLKVLDQIYWLPPELVNLVRRVLRAQESALAAFEDGSSYVLPQPAPSDEEHRQGIPLLARKNFSADLPQERELLRAIQGILSRLGGPFKEASQRFGKLKSKGEISADALFRAHLNDDEEWFAGHRQGFTQVPGLLRFMAQSSLSPFAYALTRNISRSGGHDPASIWTYGHCPHCGSHPSIGELRGAEGARLHACSFCLLIYRAKRMQCPFCLEENSEKMAFFIADTEPGYQVHVCRSCEGYIKLADSRQKIVSEFIPAIDDLLSLPLDMLAVKEGFHRPTPSLWGF